MDDEELLQRAQEQGTAAWIEWLKQIRKADLAEKLAAHDYNLKETLKILREAKQDIVDHVLVTERGGVRGGAKGVHGFIGERLEVSIANAKNAAQGLKPEYWLVDDNGSVDYFRNGTPIQQKLQRANNFGFTGEKGIAGHWDKYPEFHEKGVYQVHKEAYQLLMMPEEEAKKLVRSSSTNGFSYGAWKRMHAVLDARGIDISRIEPTEFGYPDAQKDTFPETLNREGQNAREEKRQQRAAAREQARPTLDEGLRTAGGSAAIEGGMHFTLGVYRKLKEGKKLPEFTAQDWKDIGLDTAKGTATGAIRGAAIYGMTNFTATPAAVASAFVTAAFGVAAQARQLEQGTISEDDFVCNSTVLCLDVGISALASLAGQILIPVPVLGAVIGNCVGMFYWNICKDFASERECMLADAYRQDMQALNAQLHAQYLELLARLQREFEKFESMQQLAFDEDVNRAFAGSVELALFVGVPEQKILTGAEQIDQFFTT